MSTKVPNFILCESTGKYRARRALTAEQIIRAAKRVLNNQVCNGISITNSDTVKDYLVTYFAGYTNEVFLCLFMNNQNRLITEEVLSTGSINSSVVYPREVVKRCMALNAASVIFAHNHPSGSTKASLADKIITKNLKEALKLVDVRVLDHVIVGGGKAISLAGLDLI